MTEHPHLPPMPAATRTPPWTSTPLVLGTFAVALVFAVVALVAVRWTTDWPQWSDPAVLGVLSATAWAAGRVTRSDLWALFWDCAKVAWLSGALIFGGHLLIPSDGFIEGAVVTWGSFAGLLLWRRWQVARGVRESMEAPIIGPRRQQPRG